MSLNEYKLNPNDAQEIRLQNLIEDGNAKELLRFFKDTLDVSDSLLYKCLYKALVCDDADIARVIFAAGADISHGNHFRLLLVAIKAKNPQLVQLLIDEKINIELPDPPVSGPTLLQVVIIDQDLDILKLLLSAEFTLDYEDGEGLLAIHTAAQTSTAVTRVLVDAKVDVNVPIAGKGYTPLQCAIEKDLSDVVELLLESGADPGFVDQRTGHTALHMAVIQDNRLIIDLLLGKMKPSEINKLSDMSRSCLHEAAANNRTNLMERLMAAGALADIQNDDGNTALMCAVDWGYLTCALELLHQTPPRHFWSCMSTRNKDGNTILHMLAEKGKVCHGILEDIMSKLDNDQILNDVNNHGETAVMVATKYDNIKGVALFIIAGADVNIGCSSTGSPLQSAILLGHDVARVLLESPVLRLDTCDSNGETALHTAASIGNCYIIEAMLDKGVTAEVLNKQSAKGNTVLHHLVQNSTNEELLRVLQRVVEGGVQLDTRNESGDTALIQATKHKSQNVQSIEDLLKLGAQVNIANNEGKTALHYTCELKRTYVSYCLLEYGSDCNMQNTAGNTPLHFAAAVAEDEIVLRLLMKKCDLNIKSKFGQTALHTASACGNVGVVKILIEQGATVDVPGAVPSPLINAARKGHLEILKMLLEQKADVNLLDKLGRNALMWASQGGYVECIHDLLKHGANPKVIDESGDTALTLAAWSGQIDAIKILIPLSDLDNCEKEEGMSALYLAIAKDHRGCVQLLLDAGADINLVDHHGNTALLTAAMLTTGTEILDIILCSGRSFDINAVGNKGRTAVHWAVGEPDSVELLAKRKLNMDLVDDNKATPLLLAIAHQQPRSAEILIRAGCDINMVHVDGRSPIHHAAVYNDAATARLLIDCGVDPDVPMQDGRRPLLLAAISNNVDVLQILIRCKVDLDIVYNDAFTTLSTAVSNRYGQIIRILLDFGADPNVIGSGKHLPLVHAIIEGYISGMVCLIQAGASTNIHANKGYNPLEIAILNKNTKVVQILLEVGSDPNLLRAVIKEGTVVYFIEDDSLLNAIQFLAKQPQSLHILCRDVLRQNLKKPFLSNIKHLSLPQRLKNYVLMVDMKDKWVET